MLGEDTIGICRSDGGGKVLFGEQQFAVSVGYPAFFAVFLPKVKAAAPSIVTVGDDKSLRVDTDMVDSCILLFAPSEMKNEA